MPPHRYRLLPSLSFRLILRNVFTTDVGWGERGEEEEEPEPFFRKVRTHNVRKPETPECAWSAGRLPSSCVRGLTHFAVAVSSSDFETVGVGGEGFGIREATAGSRVCLAMRVITLLAAGESVLATKALSHRFALMCLPFCCIMLWVGPQDHFTSHQRGRERSRGH